MLRRKVCFLVVFMMLFSAFTVSMPLSVSADSDVAQSGANPIVFDQTITTDNMIPLMAAGSEHNSGLAIDDYGWPKHFWINNFGHENTSDYLKWTVNLATGANYHVWALLSAGSALPFKLSDGSNVLNFTSNNYGWDKLDCGVINIPSGTSTLTLIKNDSSGNSVTIKSLELIRDSDNAAYQSRISAFKQDTTWLSQSKYGIMFQYGGWGYPQTGTTRKSLAQGATDFNVNNFISMVKSTGASYVVWSITWWDYWMQAPISSVNTIMGDSSLTESSRDLIGDVASACHANGLKFMLYYHQGLQQEPTWAAKQNWPASFETTGTGDRSTFFNNWCNVVTEIGNRYGTNLDGWFFDDGCVYYPAPFERLGTAARSGNSKRLISYNPWTACRFTDFQDVYFGEGTQGQSQTGSSGTGGNGVFTSGPQKGLLQQGMFTMENDWGIHSANQAITTGINSSQAISYVQSASARNVPVTFDIQMWEDGTVSSTSLGVLTALNTAIYGSGGSGMVNDNGSGVSYTGSWSTSSGRGDGDYNDDVHYTTTNNDYCQYTFTGTGVSYITEKNSDEGNVDVYIDGVLQTTVNCSNATRLAQQTLYTITGLSSGSHTIKLVKTSGTYMLVDAFNVTTSAPSKINDNASGIAYTGTWSYASNRGAGDYDDDVHYTSTNGDYFQYTFTGTGVSVVMPTSSAQGNVDIYIDGVKKTTVDTYSANYTPQQTIYSISGLSSGSHTVKAVKDDSSYMQLDDLIITP